MNYNYIFLDTFSISGISIALLKGSKKYLRKNRGLQMDYKMHVARRILDISHKSFLRERTQTKDYTEKRENMPIKETWAILNTV